MFDLSIHTYNEVRAFLEQNLRNKTTFNFDGEYELIIVSTNDEECFYCIEKYNDESLFNRLSVLDCGGYYVAVCIFKSKINITNEIIHNKIKHKDCDCFEREDCECITKYHMNTKLDINAI